MELERLRVHAGYSALHRSARDGKIGAVVDLLREGADKDALDIFGATPLMHAVEEGHLRVTEALLAVSADLTVHNTGSGDTALHVATDFTDFGLDEIVVALLKKGADKDALNNRGHTPLINAAFRGRLPSVETLLTQGADVNISGDDGSTALLYAAERGHHGIVEALLAGGAEKDSPAVNGLTPLMEAASAGHLPVVNTLLNVGADVTLVCDSDEQDCGECTALHLAICGRHLGVVNLLLSKGADKDWRGERGFTALMIATRISDLPIVRCLLAKGADADAVDDDGESALIMSLDECTAAKSDSGCRSEVFETLLAGGAGVNIGRTADNIGRTADTKCTPLGLATFNFNISAMKSLIAYGAGVNTPCCNGHTPLHVACDYLACDASVDLVDFLLRSGADETALDKNGRTPADRFHLGRALDGVEEALLRLLARAPADRAWRRRGWLVMVNSRTLKARAAGGDGGSGGSSGDGGAAGARSVKQRGGAGEKTNGGAGGDGGPSGARSAKQRGGASEGTNGAGSGKERFDLSAAVEWLGGVEEGVFRNVVGFL